jgi:hypothetical protein
MSPSHEKDFVSSRRDSLQVRKSRLRFRLGPVTHMPALQALPAPPRRREPLRTLRLFHLMPLEDRAPLHLLGQ